MALDVCLYILSALCGLVAGSFLNVCIYRLPRGEFFSKNRSFCPNCKAPIKAYDNIPVLSYLILRGKCRSCGQRISPRYPFVELLTCALWVGNYAAFGLDGMTVVFDITVAVLIVAAFVDLDTFEIPDSGIITLLVLGAITFAPFGGVSWQDKLIGCVCVSVPMLIVCLFGGMGFGDVKLYFVLGLLLGWQKILVVFLLSVVSGAVVSVVYLLIKRRKDEGADGETEDGEKDEESERAPVAQEDGQLVGNRLCSTESDESCTEEECGLTQSVDDGSSESDCAATCATGCKKSGDGTSSDDGAEEESGAGNEEDDDDPLSRKKKGRVIPFGPFIALATVVTLYGGDALISVYARLLGLQ